MNRFSWIELCVLLFLVACGDNIDFEYSDYHCNLTIDNSTHLDATLASAMNVGSPGVFTVIKPVFKNGANYFDFTNNHGLSSEKRFNAIDLRLESHHHVGMKQGLIVGFGNLEQPAKFYAYDLQCPNCFHLKTFPMRSYELTLNEAGTAFCKTCRRSYNMNTGGNIVSGDKGKSLVKYRANTTGPNGLLRVY